MSDSESHRRDVAGLFNQALRNATFDVVHRLFPENPAFVTEFTERVVEEGGYQVETVQVILHWFRSDVDVEWLDKFRQSPEGGRFLELIAEINMRGIQRTYWPDTYLPPPGTTD